MNTLYLSYGEPNIFNLFHNTNSSDIDRVAAASFELHYNELIALVLLLLISILVVVAISRPSTSSKNKIYFGEEFSSKLPNQSDIYLKNISKINRFRLGNIKMNHHVSTPYSGTSLPPNYSKLLYALFKLFKSDSVLLTE